MLLEFEVHTFGWQVLAAVDPVRFPEADGKSLCLVQFGRGQEKEHLAIHPRLGAAPVQVPHEHTSVDGMRSSHGVRV